MATPKKDKATAPPFPPPASGPMTFREILGQERIISYLKTAGQKGRLSHAYLFLGPEGVGKACTARALAAALNCLAPLKDGDACGACASCRRLAAGVHPDFLVIGPAPDSQQIKIGQIREFRRLTAYPPFGDGWRVALIKPGEAMNDEAANALLKTLEEPPERHLLALTARVEADLLPTVVSRCHKLAFVPLPAALVARELRERRGLAPPQARLLAALSGGSLGRALTLDPEAILANAARCWPIWRPSPAARPAWLSIGPNAWPRTALTWIISCPWPNSGIGTCSSPVSGPPNPCWPTRTCCRRWPGRRLPLWIGCFSNLPPWARPSVIFRPISTRS